MALANASGKKFEDEVMSHIHKLDVKIVKYTKEKDYKLFLQISLRK
jgi:hypothetical protein